MWRCHRLRKKRCWRSLLAPCDLSVRFSGSIRKGAEYNSSQGRDHVRSVSVPSHRDAVSVHLSKPTEAPRRSQRCLAVSALTCDRLSVGYGLAIGKGAENNTPSRWRLWRGKLRVGSQADVLRRNEHVTILETPNKPSGEHISSQPSHPAFNHALARWLVGGGGGGT